MTKSQLFIGPKGSGKSQRAKELMNEHTDPVMVQIGSDKDLLKPFVFADCTADTSLIVMDDLDYNKVSWIWLADITENGVVIQRYGKPKFKIWPNFIFISENVPKTMAFKSNPHYDVTVF